MNSLLDRLARHVAERPHAPAVRDEDLELDYGSLAREVERLSGLLPLGKVGLLLGNGAHWACLDLALLKRTSVCVPMPEFFSNAQLEHLIRDADLDMVVTDDPERVTDLLNRVAHARLEVAGRPVWLFPRDVAARRDGCQAVPRGTVKITYTSGTTGQPRGVCLSGATIRTVVDSLCEAVGANPDDRALSLLPLSTLLENIAGLYAPLWTGALAQVPGPASCGLAGSSGFQRRLLLDALQRYAPTTTILVPQLLKAITEGMESGMAAPGSLRFAALGGAPTPASLLERARSSGLPVYQGYGLSEAGSVACLNTPSRERAGSVGRPLPHARVSIAEDGEVLVSGSLLLAYLGSTGPTPGSVWPTGDLGYLDEDGFLFLTGRKKTAYATASGRNVAPEWVESELCSDPLIAQAAVFGEGQAINVAILVPAAQVTARNLNAAIDAVNARLPGYARVGRWIVADQPFSPRNGLANGAGCIRREAIRTRYQTRIEEIYLNEERHAVF